MIKRRKTGKFNSMARRLFQTKLQRARQLIGEQTAWGRRHIDLVVVVATIPGALLMLYVAAVVARFSLQSDSFSEEDLRAAQIILLGIFATIGLWLAYRRTNTATKQADTAVDQVRAAEYGRRTDRFTKGVDMLGNEAMLVRIGGQDLLNRLAWQDPEEFGAIVCNSLMRVARHPPTDAEGIPAVTVRRDGEDVICKPEEAAEWLHNGEDVHFTLRSDIAYAVEIAAYLMADLEPRSEQGLYTRLNLQRVDLRGLDMSFRPLNGAILTGSRLEAANFTSCSLRYAELSGATLEHANLSMADLQRATLHLANLDHTGARQINLQGASLKLLSFDGFVAEDSHASDARIEVANAQNLRQLCQHLWAWADRPPMVSYPRDPNAEFQVRLYDPAARPEWERQYHQFPETEGFGPPEAKWCVADAALPPIDESQPG